MKMLARALGQVPPVPGIVEFAEHDGPVHCHAGIEKVSDEVSPCIWNHMRLQKTGIGLGIDLLVQDNQGGSTTIMDPCLDVHRSTTMGNTWHDSVL